MRTARQIAGDEEIRMVALRPPPWDIANRPDKAANIMHWIDRGYRLISISNNFAWIQKAPPGPLLMASPPPPLVTPYGLWQKKQPRPPWEAARREYVVFLRENGASYDEIGARLGVSSARIYQLVYDAYRRSGFDKDKVKAATVRARAARK